MKYSLVLLLAVVLLSSCSKREFSDLDQLKEHVETSLRANNPDEIKDAFYWEGSDPEIKAAFSGILEGIDNESLPIDKIEVLELNAYEPDGDLPGHLNGRKLVWLIEPSHWIVAHMSNMDESGNGMELDLSFVAAEVNGKWRLIGAGYSEEPMMRDIVVPGLTDVNATVIAFDLEGNVVDFVHIKPDSDIESIIFSAPEDEGRISVVVVGPSCSPELSESIVVWAFTGKNVKAEVTVSVENGIVTGMFGHGISPYCPLDADDLKEVHSQLESENRVPSDRVKITRK